MRAFCATLLLAVSGLRAHGAAGDIIGQSVGARGWVLDLNVEGVATNGAFNLGWTGSYGTIGQQNPKVVLKMLSPGYDAEGNAITVPRTVYGGKQLRMPWPGHGYSATEDTPAGADIHVSLSDFVYAADSDLTLSIAAGLYDDGSVETTLLSGATVTNNSTLTYPKARFRWAHPEFLWHTGATMTVQISADHAYGWGGGTMASVWFIASTNGTAIVTNKVTTETPRRFPRTGLWEGVYQSTFDTALFPSNEVRVDVVLYPKLGDSNAVFDTRLNEFSGFVVGPRALTNFVDVGGNYGGGVAVVDYAEGDDSKGLVFENADPASIPVTNRFKLGSAAYNAIAAWNNSNRGHNDVGGGRVYYRAGVSNLCGATLTATTIPKTYVYAIAYPGDTVVWTSNAGSDDVADRLWVSGITIGYGSGVSGFNGVQSLVLQDCTIDSESIAWGGSDYHLWLIDCWFVRSAQGLGSYGNEATQHYVTGCILDPYGGSAGAAQYIVGCRYVSAANSLYRFKNWNAVNTTMRSADWTMVRNNELLHDTIGSSTGFDFGGGTNTLVGFTVSGNVFQNCAPPNSGNLLFVGSDAEFITRGVTFRHNTVVGRRHGFFYNDGDASQKTLNFVQGNVLEILGVKTDTFGGGEDSSFTNNWSFVWGVGCNANVRMERQVDSSAGAFPWEWDGLQTLYNRTVIPGTNIMTFPQFVQDNGYIGTGVDGGGGGDYRPQATSPIQQVWAPHTTIVDLYGNTRTSRDPAGAVAAGNPRR